MSLGSLLNEIARVEKTHPCTDGISDKPDAPPASVSLSDVRVDVLVEPAHRRSQLVLELPQRPVPLREVLPIDLYRVETLGSGSSQDVDRSRS